ncbi:HNH endonuclease [Mycobacteroides abscessus]|uniref:HNH endonuclease n=1 Tax=Mycobacteroides abscessus TaxID=36809 RepID=UPI001A9835DC
MKINGKPHFVHLLMLTMFVGPRPVGAMPKWLNGDVTDNRAENLCWYLDLDSQPAEFDRCRSGHEYTPENTEVWGSKNRICKACRAGLDPVVELPEVL